MHSGSPVSSGARYRESIGDPITTPLSGALILWWEHRRFKAVHSYGESIEGVLIWKGLSHNVTYYCVFLRIKNPENLLWSVPFQISIALETNTEVSLVLPPPLAQTKLPQKTVFFIIFLSNVVLFTAFTS